MALQFFDGFEGYASVGGMPTNGWAVSGNGQIASAITPTSRSGASALQIIRTGSVGDWMGVVMSAFKVSGYAGFGLNRGTAAQGAATFFLVMQSTSVQLQLRLNADFSISLMRGTTEIAVSAANVILAPNNYYFIDFTWTIDPTGGAARVRVDGVPVIAVTGVNTQATAAATWSRVAFQNVSVTATATLLFDDFYVGDTDGAAPHNTALGDVRVLQLRPSSDVAVSWVPSTGTTNFSNVNKAAFAATPNNASDVVGAVDRFGLTDLPYTPTAIYALRVMATGKKSDTGARTARNKLWSGVAVADGVTYSPLTADATFADTYLTDPNTGAAWTPAAVNALNGGYEIVT